MRPVFPDTENYPRYVGTARGPVYYPKPGQAMTQPIGHIPEVEETFAYLEGNYGIQNEKQLSIGESTCSAVFVKEPAPVGKAIMSVNELSRIAMERSNSSRAAVELMGALAEEYGFYGPCTDPAVCFEGSGETLLVADPEEGWIFHILPDDTGASAIWVAKRVPDDEATVVMNMFTIREVDLTDTANYLGSSNMHKIALAHGFWDGKGLLDFTLAFSNGEYNHLYYSGRRMWGAFGLLAPSLELSANYSSLRRQKPYPWSVKPDQPISVKDVMEFHRYHYEGSPFSTTEGLSAGAWGTPDRYQTEGTSAAKQIPGAWERTIGLFRTTYTWIVQANSQLPAPVAGTTWIGLCDADKTTFVPFMVGMEQLPYEYTNGNQQELEKGTAFWATRYVQNMVQLKYSYMIKDVRAVQDDLIDLGLALQSQLQSQNPVATVEEVTLVLYTHAQAVVKAYLELSDILMFKYADGYLTDKSGVGQTVGYSAAWLEAVDWGSGPQLCNPTCP